MLENLDVLASAKRAAEELFQSLQATWKQVLDMDSRTCGVPSSVLFFSSSFLFLFFTFLSFFSGCSEHFPLLIVGTLGLHTILRLTRNTICTTLHYQVLFSYILSLFVLFYSPELPREQAKILLPILLPMYYHFMTSSVQSTLLFSVPYLFFLQCSFLYSSFPNSSILAAFLIIPTSILTNTKDLQKKLEQNNKLQFNGNTPEQERSQDNAIEVSQAHQAPRLKEKKDSEISISEIETEEQEKVILGISHDCRNLLNSLKATLTLIKDESSGDETTATQDDNLQSAIAITEHLTLLLTNLLDYLRRKSDDTNFSQETRLTTTLEKIWLMMSPNLKKKNLGGSITIKNGTPLALQLDEHKFMGILLNLIGNSTKFTDTGHIKINVHWRESPPAPTKPAVDSQQNHVSKIRDRLKKADIAMKRADSKSEKEETEQANPVLSKTTFFDLRDIDSISFSKKCFTAVNDVTNQANQPGHPADQGVLVVSVRDTGCGIDEESLKKIFKKYGQVSEDQEKNKMGLGLGLWYTKYLLKKMKGKIDFRSSKNVGTWAKIEIPCKVAPKKREIQQMIRPEVRMQARGKALNETSYVFIRENDRLGSLLVKEYVKKHLKKEAKVVEVKSLSDIMRSEDYRNEHCVLILGENAATRSEIQTLDMIKRLNHDQKLTIVLLRDFEEKFKAGENAWGNTEVDTIVKKPLRTVQLNQVVASIKSAIESRPAMENKGSHDEQVPCVLIVDDDETIRTFSQKCLEKNGISSFVAKDGFEALEIYKKENKNIKFILMDSEMPKMNGLDATKEIRKVSNDGQLKIFGLTGDDSQEFREKARENGMNEVFMKPLPVDQLLRVVQTAM